MVDGGILGCFLLKSDIIKVTGGDGTQVYPYTLEV